MYTSFAGYAILEICTSITSVDFDVIDGDKTGTVIVGNHQVVEVAKFQPSNMLFLTHCNFKVESGATLAFPALLSIDETSLIVAGQLAVENVEVEENGMLHFLSGSNIARRHNDSFRSVSNPGEYFFTSLTLKRGSSFSTEEGTIVKGGLFHMKVNVNVVSDFFDIETDEINIEEGSVLDVSGRSKYNESQTQDCNGGGYGGPGGVGSGVDSDQALPSYGTIYEPTDHGSSGAGSVGGSGGASIRIKSYDLRIDGVLRADGDSSTQGGGSGGSIWLTSMRTFIGTGEISAVGGASSATSCGSGGGGRISVHSEDLFDFTGTYSATGGAGNGGDGGPGSIYLRSKQNYTYFERLIVDNNNGQDLLYFTLNETWTEGRLDVLELTNNGLFRVVDDNIPRSLDLRSIIGDGTGLIHIHRNQTIFYEATHGANQIHTTTDVNLKVDKDGTIIFPPLTFIAGTGLLHVALELNGQMYGVHDLVLTEGRTMTVSPLAFISYAESHMINSSATPGVFTFGNVELYAGSLWIFGSVDVNFTSDMSTVLHIGSVRVKFGASVVADYINASISFLDIEIGSRLTCSGLDRPEFFWTETAGIAPDDRSGAGHGSYGGQYDDQPGGPPYGSLYWPTKRGSDGGGGSKGGGTIMPNSYTHFHEGKRKSTFVTKW